MGLWQCGQRTLYLDPAGGAWADGGSVAVGGSQAAGGGMGWAWDGDAVKSSEDGAALIGGRPWRFPSSQDELTPPDGPPQRVAPAAKGRSPSPALQACLRDLCCNQSLVGFLHPHRGLGLAAEQLQF
jgi:hypothetical protein